MSTLIIIYLCIGAAWAGACVCSNLADLSAIAREEQRDGGISTSAIALALAAGVLLTVIQATLAWPWSVRKAWTADRKGAR